MSESAPVVSCKRCLYTTGHPFGLTINKDGICSGCIVHEEKDNLDWDFRLKELQLILNQYRSTDGSHDCIVHIDGTAQTYYVVYLLTKILKMNPLLVNFNSHFISDIGIKNIDQLVTRFDLNMYQTTLSPNDYRNLVKHSALKLKNIFWPYLAGKTSLPYRMAVKLNIPLVIHGGLQTVEQVGMFSHKDNVEYSRWYRKQHDLMGVDETDFLLASGAINENIMNAISYPTDSQIIDNGIRGIFLSNYFRWDPWAQNIKMLVYGFTPQLTERSFDSFENAGCSAYFGIHDILRELNCGYSKSREHLSREIRFGRIARVDAYKLYGEYKKKYNKSEIEEFFKWLKISKEGRNWLEEFAFPGVSYGSDSNSNSETFNPFNERKRGSVKATEFFKLFGKGI